MFIDFRSSLQVHAGVANKTGQDQIQMAEGGGLVALGEDSLGFRMKASGGKAEQVKNRPAPGSVSPHVKIAIPN